jgi:hypothetical protein
MDPPGYMDDEYGQNDDFEASGFPSSVLSGDFYRESEDVTRGVSLPMGGFGPGDGFPSKGGFGPVDGFSKGGDFYGQSEDVFRGLDNSQFHGLDLPSDKFGLPMGMGADLYPPLLKGADLCPPPFMEDFPSKHSSGKSPDPCFHDNDPALPAPDDEFFQYEITTLVILCDRAGLLMNALVACLETEVQGTITKLKRAKCCIKADVFIKNVMCSIKVKGYQQELGKLALEFQRRSGDSLAFSGVYGRAAKRLQPQFHIIAGMPEDRCPPGSTFCWQDPNGGMGVPPPPLLLPQGNTVVDVNMFGLQLDMAKEVNNPQSQAEAAAALATATEDPAVADAFCADIGAIQDIASLSCSDRREVSVPLNALLSNLSRSPYAEPHRDYLNSMIRAY